MRTVDPVAICRCWGTSHTCGSERDVEPNEATVLLAEEPESTGYSTRSVDPSDRCTYVLMFPDKGQQLMLDMLAIIEETQEPDFAVRVPLTRDKRALLRSGAASLAVLLTGCSMQPLPLGATVQAQPIHAMWIVFFWSAIGVAAVVYGLIAWCVIRYRRRPSDTSFPKQFRRNNRMEIVYTGIPLLMAGALFSITYPAERHVETIASTQGVVVNVTGFRWSWRFDYPQFGTSIIGTPDAPPEFVLPIDETARFNVTSVDVDHSFWVPDFLFKRDALPGVENVFDWTPNRLGAFRGECAEFCGLDHALMSFSIKVVSRTNFQRWIQAHRRVALAGSSARP